MTTDIAIAITITSCVCGGFISVVLMLATLIGGNLKEKIYRWFFIALLINAVGTFAEAIAAILMGQPGDSAFTLFQIFDFASYLFGSLMTIPYSMYFYEFLSIKKPTKKMPFVLMMVVMCINIVILAIQYRITSPGFLLDTGNYYPRDFIILAKIFPTIILLMLAGVTMSNIKSLKPREWMSLLSYVVMPLVCYGIESIFEDYPFWISYFGLSAVLLLLYANIQVELKYTLLEKEAELTESRVAIMLSQIQPHFLYNTLGAIDKLYFENTEEGHNAIVKFSAYLRSNMDSISNKKRIPFAEELTHVKQYLWLEQLRFEENLQVFYNIQTDAFSLPVLTLQPVVENAVRHGVTKKKNGGSVTIKTIEAENYFRIEVTDDGVGFDTDNPHSDNHSHIGINNVRERLRAMCGGTLTLHSESGKGTKAIIEIPKEEALQ